MEQHSIHHTGAPDVVDVDQAPAPDVVDVDQPKGHDYASWPVKGGTDAPQPWDLAGQGIPPHELQLEPGAPNTVAPIVVDHGMPILTSGSGGPEVHELGRLLAGLGYETSVSRGENPFGILDPTVLAAVERFRQDYGVEEDPTGFGGNHDAGRVTARNHVGPWTWEALIRAAERERA
jgi:hypothetical protein